MELDFEAFICISASVFILILIQFSWKASKNRTLEIETTYNSGIEDKINSFKPKALIDQALLECKSCTTSSSTDSIDLAKVNYLDLLNNGEIRQECVDCVRHYGIGTCGPPSFYGITNVHLNLEHVLANFMGMEEAVAYAYGFAAPSSTVCAYCRENDLIFCDEKVNFALEQGIKAAKSKVYKFKHNDYEDLNKQLEEVTAEPHFNKNTRKFLILEGIYARTGKICPLSYFICSVKKYKMRVFVDESLSFGILGATGRGITEHCGIAVTDIDVIIGSLEGPLASIGGFCVGKKTVIKQQCWRSLAYVYSASLSTLHAQAAICGVEIIKQNSNLICNLQKLSVDFHKGLIGNGNFVVHSDPLSPYKVFNYKCKGDDRIQREKEIWEYCRSKGVVFIYNFKYFIINLNVSLYYDESKLLTVFRIINEATLIVSSMNC